MQIFCVKGRYKKKKRRKEKKCKKITSIGRGDVKPPRRQSNRTGALGSPNLASIPHTPGVIKNQTHPRSQRQSLIIHTLHKALPHQAPPNYRTYFWVIYDLINWSIASEQGLDGRLMHRMKRIRREASAAHFHLRRKTNIKASRQSPWGALFFPFDVRYSGG